MAVPLLKVNPFSLEVIHQLHAVCIYIIYIIYIYIWQFICICVYMNCVHECTCIGCYMIHTIHMNIWTYPVIQETKTGGFSPYLPGPYIPVAGQSTRKLTYSRRHHVSWCQEHPMPCYWWVINELTPKHLCYDWKLKKTVFISPVNKSTFLNMESHVIICTLIISGF